MERFKKGPRTNFIVVVIFDIFFLYVSRRNIFDNKANQSRSCSEKQWTCVCISVNFPPVYTIMSRKANVPVFPELETSNKSPLEHHEDDETKRHGRNESERKRRNRFNRLIDELAICIADRCKTKRSTEKGSILKLTMEYFHEQQIIATEKAAKESGGSIKPDFVTQDEFNYVFLESSCTFVFAVDISGNFMYISENILNGVGHLPSQVLQRNVFDFIYAQDHFIFQGLLSNLKSDAQLHGILAQGFESFSCHFRRGCLFSCIHRCGCCGQCNGFETLNCTGTILRNLPKEGFPNLEVSDCILVLAKPLNRAPLNTTLLRADGRQTKFTATLSIEAKYDYLDKRVASVLGFYPSELIGNSLFEYCHHEDLADLVEYHEILLLTGRITTCCYRHLTKGQSWIWLRSRYHLCYNNWSSKPQALTCLSWVLSYEEVCAKQEEILARDRQKFSQIRRAGHEGTDVKSPCSDELNYPVAASPGCISESSELQLGKASRVSDFIQIPEFLTRTASENSLDRTSEWQDSQADISTPQIPDSSELMENELAEFEGFLQTLHLPVNLTTAQYDLHEFLSRLYVQLVSAIHKQREELCNIQKQIQIQGELRDLVERLEEARAKNDTREEHSTTRNILHKFEEMRRVCAGSCDQKPAAESFDICIGRFQGIDSEKRSQERQSSAAFASNQVLSEGIKAECDYSPMQVDKPSAFSQQRQNVFYNQKQWLQTQAQQTQLQQHERQSSAVFQRDDVLSTGIEEELSHSPMKVNQPSFFQRQHNVFYNQEEWFQTQAQQAQLQRQFLIQQLSNTQYLPQEEKMTLLQAQQSRNNQINQQILSQGSIPQSFYNSSNAQAFGMVSPQETLTIANEAFFLPLSQTSSYLPLSPSGEDGNNLDLSNLY